jgi:trk system potassium uptake protein TrkH
LIAGERLQRVVRGETLGVDLGAALNLVAALVKWFSLAFLVPAAIAVGYGEDAWIFVVPCAVTAAFGAGLERVTSGKERVGMREGFLVISLLWLFVGMLGAIPYLLSRDAQVSGPANAFFEAMSGFTTTGATILTDTPALSRSLLMWRQLTQWFGGLGIVIVAIAVLPRLRVAGRQALFRYEAAGPELESFGATIRAAARRFVLLYAGLSAIAIATLSLIAATGMDSKLSAYDAVGHALTSVSTGGFSTKARSATDLGATTQWALVVFMFAGATNFALLFAGVVRRRVGAFARDEEFRLYVAVLVVGSSIVLATLLSQHAAEGEAAVRQAIFNMVSMVTTTGYGNADFAIWPALTGVVFVGGMLIGGCAGSTAGGIKVVRHLIIARLLRRELDQTVHPELVSPLRLNGRPIEERALQAIVVFAFVYVGVLAAATTILMIDATRTGLALTPFEALAAVAASQCNGGAALGFAGPFGSFDPFGDLSKAVLIVVMWLGRLEIVPVLVLFSRRYWRA